MGHTGRALAACLFTLSCCAATLHAQAATEETGNFVVGGTVIWVKATDAGVVQLFMSQGYRDAFARPIALPAASLRRWAESAQQIASHQSREHTGGDSAEVSSGSLGESGMVLERWVAPTGGGVRVERGGQVILHMPDDPGRTFIAAVAEAAKLTQEASAPRASKMVAQRAAVPAPRATPPRLTVVREPMPDLATPYQTVAITAAPPGASEMPRVKLRTPAARAAQLIPAPAARVNAAMHPAVVRVAAAPAGAARAPSVRVPAPRVVHMALVPAARIAMTPAAAPVTAPSRAPRAPHAAMPAARSAALLAGPRAASPAASPAASLAASPSAPPAAPPTSAPREEDKHIRTPLGPFVVPAAAMRTRASQVQYCYAQLGQRYDPDLTGSIAVRVSLAADTDSVTNVEITGRTWSTDGVTAGEVEACVRTLIRDWRFEPSEIRRSDRTIELHFTFHPDQADKR